MTLLKKKGKKKIKTCRNTMNLVILVDASGSMNGHESNVNKILQDQISDIRKTKPDANISIGSFNSDMMSKKFNLDYLYNNEKGEDLEDIDPSSYKPDGGTPLNDALLDAISKLETLDTKTTANLIVVITDGEENTSKTSTAKIAKMISELRKTDRWTFAIACPALYTTRIEQNYGIPAGCITSWNQTTEGFRDVSRKLTRGTTMSYSNMQTGNLSNVNYFTPDVDLTTKTIKSNLDEVTDQFKLFNVKNSDNLTISSFVTSKRMKFSIGDAYYQLSKPETVQDYKNIVLMKNSTGKLYSGGEIRNLLSIPESGTIKLMPNRNLEYTVYIRSTSWNRKLVPGTKVLVKK